MATIKPLYATQATITITLASLATSAARTAGRESTRIDNTTTRYADAMVRGFIACGTTPTAGKQIDIWLYGSDEDPQTVGNEVDVLDGTDSAETITSERVRNGALKLAQVLEVDATSNSKYFFNFHVAEKFGGRMPKFWGVFVSHDCVAALNATGTNHEFTYTGIQDEIV